MSFQAVIQPIPIKNVVVLHLKVHDRIREAAETLRFLPNTDRRFLAAGAKCSWPSYVREWTAYNNEPAQFVRVPPTNGAIDRMQETIGWISWLATQDSQEALIVWYSFGTCSRTRTIARRLAASLETVRRKRKSGILRILERFEAEIRNGP